ncbi:MAG: ScpA family protein [Phycisphaerales bacterium]
MTQQDYIVRLDAFEGPLDLLLHLIRRAEVDVQDIAISTLTDQYIDHLKGIESIDIDTAGEFLVMAATLMEIKARTIAPPEESQAGGEGGSSRTRGESDDPRADLVRQLLAYKRVREAAEALETRREEWERRHPSGRAHAEFPVEESEGDESVDVEDLNLFDLARAFARILETVDVERATKGAHEVSYDDTPIEEHAADIVDRLRGMGEGSRLTLRSVMEGRTRSEMLGLFLATLELIRRREVTVMVRGGEGLAAGEEVEITLNADPGDALVVERLESQEGAIAWDDDDDFGDDGGDDDEGEGTGD